MNIETGQCESIVSQSQIKQPYILRRPKANIQLKSDRSNELRILWITHIVLQINYCNAKGKVNVGITFIEHIMYLDLLVIILKYRQSKEVIIPYSFPYQVIIKYPSAIKFSSRHYCFKVQSYY